MLPNPSPARRVLAIYILDFLSWLPEETEDQLMVGMGSFRPIAILALIFVTVLCYPALVKSQVGTTRITDENAIGTATYDDLVQLAQTIVAQDKEAYYKMFAAGRARSLSVGTEVYILETKNDGRVYRVRPKGETFSVWIPQGALK